MTARKSGLGRDVYIALAAVGWADGQLDQEEADAIVRTALEDGLSLDEIVANLSDNRPLRYDLLALRRIIGERLAASSHSAAGQPQKEGWLD